ncbi:PH domain-containing protein [Plectosphaerella cucumerina]|uniref:PH domain-containing protein n=1 Tax=Plectosphaerella cucumerina TaxID=40658 RepID=A0A8K0T6U6_9PEZI|nr:PH domain-containing protein [Plectosphaerella cucumerina]
MSEITSVAPPAPAAQPLKQQSLAIPVVLNEAGLDSPTFRATAVHFAEQIDAIERWLEDYVRSTTKVSRDILALEENINFYLSRCFPPAAAADAIIDHDYTLLALRRASDGSREWWTQVLATMRKLDSIVAEPVRQFLAGEMRSFRDVRKNMDLTQRQFDLALGRYVGQPKNKEPSSLREDAFAVYEARKAYLTASMDYCQLAPQLRASLDKLLVRVSSDMWHEIKRSREAGTASLKWGDEMERIRGWSREIETTEGVFKRELQKARRDIGQSSLHNYKPSRELEDYSASTVPFLGSRGPVNAHTQDQEAVISERQGWLFLKNMAGKPARANWVRRWYYCRDGIFGWLIQGPQGVLQGDEIGVLLCSTRPAVSEDRRFCFEIKTKSQNMVLQAETQAELTEWLEVFEVAKKKAFEATMARDHSPLPAGHDPAFQITPAPIAEFSAKSLDAQLAGEETTINLDRAGTLPVPGSDLNLSSRQSFDVNATIGSRRSITALGRDLSRDLVREEGESGREHAARIIQKLDLHRKATFGGDLDAKGSPNPGSGGIASLISASHGLLPGYAPPLAAQGSSKSAQNATFPTPEALQGSLAPSTLAKAPIPTPLSRLAVLVTGEKGLAVDGTSNLPAAVMANYWGTNPWTMIYGVGHGTPRTPAAQVDENPFGIVAHEIGQPGEEKSSVTHTHRKTVSADTRSQPMFQSRQRIETFPPGYPMDLKAQHAQFRMLFPAVPLDEKLVLVFTAAWTSSTGRQKTSLDDGELTGNGRIFVTSDNMYFYGQQMGLVIAYTLSLDIITEVTASPGKDCDYIFLHLGDDTNETGYARVTIKVFLDDLGLLQSRLNLLVDDLQAEEPMTLQELVTALISLEHEHHTQRSPSVGSWEEVSSSTPIDDGTAMGRPVQRMHEFGPRLHAQRSPARPWPKFQLPVHPVVFEPEDMQRKVAERHFEISAKACFHVLFGDKSFVFPKLYFERRAQRIAQGPWVLEDHGRMKREFKFKVDYPDILGRSKSADVTDYQTIDVFQDHVTYVVSHVKTAWHLPHSQHLKLVAKIVITHVAKSKCKLAIFTRVDWSKMPTFSKALVERQALDDAGRDAEELADVTTDQVRKLGPHSRTKRAIQVYGNLGQQTQVLLFSPAETESAKKQVIKARTLTAMLLETVRSFGESALTSVIMWSIAGVRKLFSVITAHRLLLLLLGFSALINAFWAGKESSTWWAERQATQYMRNLGIGPNVMMSKAIYLADISDASGTTGYNSTWPEDSACFTAFQLMANSTDMDAPHNDAGAALSSSWGKATARRIRRTRQKLGSYRHDLLVAMRVVNSIEREMVQSEWENWLADETQRCGQLKMLLREEGGESKAKGSSQQKVLGGEENQRRQKLQAWHESYCGSCQLDQKALAATRDSAGL